MRVLLLSILVAALNALSLGAAQPGVGDAAPDFTLRSLGGGEVTLSEFVADGPIALVVLRGYPGYQCPVCSRQVHDFIANADGFKEAGARVLFVYPGPSDDLQSRAEEFVADKTFPSHFTMLIDPGYEFTNLYDLRWEAPRETAYPATFLMGRDRNIFYANISDSHGGRTAAGEMIELLKKVR
jgi:peroxiredoxin